MGSTEGDGIVWFCKANEKSGVGEEARAGDSAAWGADSLRRAEGGGVLAGEDFWGEMDLARSVRYGINKWVSSAQCSVNNAMARLEKKK